MILFKLANDPNLRVCAEPPPTVGEELNKAFQAAVKASLEKDATSKKGALSGNVLSSLSTNLKQFEKPKGIQYEQDMLYSLCQLHINYALTDREVRELYENIASRSERILLAEIEHTKVEPLATARHVLNRTRRIKDGGSLELKILNKEILSAYSSLHVETRKRDGDQAPDEIEWKPLRSNPTLSKGYVIKINNVSSGNLDVDRSKDATLLEAALRVEPKPGAPKIDYLATGHFVFYKNNGDQASAELPDSQTPLTDKETTIPLIITFPEYWDTAFPEFSLETVVLKGEFQWNSEKVPGTLFYFGNKEGRKHQWNLSVDTESDRERIKKARDAGDVNLYLSFQGLLPNRDLPTFPAPATTLSQLDATPVPVTVFRVSEEKQTSIKLEWSPVPDDPKTGYVIEYKESTDGGTPKTKTITDPNLSEVEIDGLTAGKTYNFTMVTLNKTKKSSPAKTSGTTTQ
nr:MAG: Fibronectin type III domain-containing protein [Candidatus Kentron sp. FM]